MQEAGTGWGGRSRVFRLSEMQEKTTAAGVKSWSLPAGAVVTGEHVRWHESMQPAGAEPSPLHTIAHTEFICVREGTVALEFEGRSERAGVGDVIVVAKGTLHHIKNVGDGPATYFVMAVGGDS